jgi:RHS repeat-associated protein
LTEVAMQNDGTIAWAHTNVYAAGKLIGTYDGDVNAPTLHYHIDDPLGTRRAQVNATGALEAVYQSLPFGDAYYQAPSGADDPTENHFTGKERDTESGNDYMFARYYNSATGRFLSPDWSVQVEPVPYAKLGDPQSLNLYAYALNNPLGIIDPDGHDPLAAIGDQAEAIIKQAWQATSEARMLMASAAAAEQAAQQQSPQSLAAQVPAAMKAAIASAKNASNAPCAGGTACAGDTAGGYHEESVKSGVDSSGNVLVSPSVPGPYALPGENPHTNFAPVDPSIDARMTDVTVFAHIHPRGAGGEGTYNQFPSAADIDFAKLAPNAINLVVGAGNNKVYFFNGSGRIGKPISWKDFMK